MSNTDLTTLSEKTLTTNVYPLFAPDRDIENQLQELPDGWRQVTDWMAWMTIGETGLEHFWKDVRDNGWERGNTRLRDAVTTITTAQGLILAVCAAFLTTTPPVQEIDYTRTRCYIWFLWAFMYSVWGLLSQLLFLRINTSLLIQGNQLVRNPLPRTAVKQYLVLFSLPNSAFILSLLFLASAILKAILGGPIDIIFFCLAFFGTAGYMSFVGIFLIKNTPESNINTIFCLLLAVNFTVILIGLVCTVHIVTDS